MKLFTSLLLVLLPTVAFAGTHCNLPSDQGRGSLFGAWDRLPITLVFDHEFYKGPEANAMKRAAATWNRWARQNGKVAFVIANDGHGMPAPALRDCSQASYTTSVRGAVGVWKIDARNNQRPSCGMNPDGSPGSILARGVQGQTDWAVANGRIGGASVLLNFDDYNRPGRPHLDVESEMLHELGHVLGLLHSCNGSNGSEVDSTTAPACFDHGVLVAPRAYADAVMFPFLEVGQVKRSLGRNDVERASCLY